MEIMRHFGEATGMRISISKSSVVPIRCAEVNLDQVLQSFQGERATLPITYLGLPITLNKVKMAQLQPILDSAALKLDGWQANLLNIGGRRELVRSVLGSLPTYLLTVIKPPKRFYKEMDKFHHKFLWAGNQTLHGSKCKVHWQHVCRPVNREGLGLVNVERFGRALHLRWLWHQWQSPSKPWVGSDLPIDFRDEALFATATKVTVHNGLTAKFWLSSWLQGGAPALMFPDLFQHSWRKNRSVPDAMRNENWIANILHEATLNILLQYTVLWILIDEAAFDPEDEGDDHIIWTRSSSGAYTAKLAYEIQFHGILCSVFPALIWKIWAPAKCKCFTWLMLQNRIWTADRLLMREWPNEYFYPMCRHNLETLTHVFQECPYTTRFGLR
jgi:hypothetical protein